MAFSSIAKDINRREILKLLGDHQIHTKQEIAKTLKLSFPTVSTVIDELVGTEIVRMEEGKLGSSSGRKAYAYRLMETSMYGLVIRIEINQIKGLVINMYGEVIDRLEVICHENISQVVIMQQIDEMLAKHQKIENILIGVPGAVHRGMIYRIDGFPDLQGCNLQQQFLEQYHVPVRVFNNMNALVCGLDHKDGENTACIHLGSKGPGCGLWVNGSYVSGFSGFQGEIGFVPYDERQTFRQIALNRSQEGKQIDYIGRMLLQVITLINPIKIVLYLGSNWGLQEVRAYLTKYLPEEVLPELIDEGNYDQDYENALYKICLEQMLELL